MEAEQAGRVAWRGSSGCDGGWVSRAMISGRRLRAQWQQKASRPRLHARSSVGGDLLRSAAWTDRQTARAWSGAGRGGAARCESCRTNVGSESQPAAAKSTEAPFDLAVFRRRSTKTKWQLACGARKRTALSASGVVAYYRSDCALGEGPAPSAPAGGDGSDASGAGVEAALARAPAVAATAADSRRLAISMAAARRKALARRLRLLNARVSAGEPAAGELEVPLPAAGEAGAEALPPADEADAAALLCAAARRLNAETAFSASSARRLPSSLTSPDISIRRVVMASVVPSLPSAPPRPSSSPPSANARGVPGPPGRGEPPCCSAPTL